MDTSMDWSRRFSDGHGNDKAFGLRVNVEAAKLRPQLHDAKATAGCWPPPPARQHAARRQVHRPAHQPEQPVLEPAVVFEGRTASLRVTHQLNSDWKLQAHGAIQRLVTDDRLAYPFGCTASDGTYYGSSYCPDGTFDQYDFRSDNEHRNSEALELSAQGKLDIAACGHDLTTGVLFSRFRSRLQGQAYNYAGTGNIWGTLPTVADPSLTGTNTDRTERSTELYLRDAVQLSERWQGWLACAPPRLKRTAAGECRTRRREPHQLQPIADHALAGRELRDRFAADGVASWGEGVESDVAPNRPEYANKGRALPAIRSKQWEFGLKSGSRAVDGRSTTSTSARRRRATSTQAAVWSRACWTDAASPRHRGAGGSEVDRRRPAGQRDEAARSRRGQQRCQPQRPEAGQRAGTSVKAAGASERGPRGAGAASGLVYEGKRMVLPDNSIGIPSWTRWTWARSTSRTWGGSC
ncbi:hypothetical protein Ddc_21574 [Ditylenchus destructor]|nr:hypothetical protein Ddc_21574 [Ditylenchus destructor]